MGLIFNRSPGLETGPGRAPALRLPSFRAAGEPGRAAWMDPVWLLAGLAMIILSACTFFLVPEESFAVVLGLLVLLLALADLRCAFLCFVLLYPFMSTAWGLDLADWIPYLTAKRVCCIVLTIMFLVHGRGSWDTPRIKRIGWFLLALLVVQLLVGFGSRDPLGAVKRTFSDVVEWYMPFFIAAHLFRTREQVRALLAVVLISLGLVAALAIVEHSTNYNFYTNFVAARDDIQAMLMRDVGTYRGDTYFARRVRVAFSHPIELGLHLMCLLLFALYALLQSGALRRTLILVSLPLFCLALLYTYSRGPLLGLICGIIWLGAVGRSTRTILPMVLLCGLGAYLLMPTPARNVLQETIMTSTDLQTGDSIGGGTVRGRLSLLRVGLQFSAQNLWFGIGPGEVRQTRLKSGGHHEHVVDFASVDNFYLLMLLNHGVIVLALTIGFYLWILGMLLQAVWRSVDPDTSLLAAVAASMCVANYVALLTVGFNITLFWILLGPAVRACDLAPMQGRRGKARRSRTDRAVRQIERSESMTPSERVKTGSPAGAAFAPRRGFDPTGIALRTPATVRRFALCPSLARWVRTCGLILPLLIVTPASQAAPGFYGTTGLFLTPTARTAPRGSWSTGATYVGRDFRPGAASYANGSVTHTLALTMLPRLEFAAVLNNWEGKIGAQRLDAGPSHDYSLAGYNVDRSVAVHWQAVTERGYQPAVAIGTRDLFGTQQLQRSHYAVASWKVTPFGERQPLDLSVGYGTRHLGGAFAGIEYSPHPRATLILEGLRGQVHGGLRVEPVKNFQLDAGLMGFRSLGGGLSYRRRF